MSTRTLAEWLSYLEQLHPSAIDMGLERARRVLERLQLGQVAERIVTVTGTNGKGSTCAFLASLLQGAGLTVGLYSSPHLHRYNERVRCNGIEASDEELCEAFAAVEQARAEVSLTYFEMGTLAAFWLFAHKKLDVLVLEVGLGGRLDAVNLLDADCALITSIGVDHIEWLGNSRESVAHEKLGIARPGKPLLCGDVQPPANLLEEVKALGCPLYLRGRDFDWAMDERSWHWRGVTISGAPIELSGLPILDLPMDNAALALQAFALLGQALEISTVAAALSGTQLAGRLERRSLQLANKTLPALLDVGHNPHAAQFLASHLAQREVSGRRVAVFGLLADKDLEAVIAPLLPYIDHWLCVTLDSPRARAADELVAGLRKQGASSENAQTVATALDLVCTRADQIDDLLVLGSFYCVAAAQDWWDTRSKR